MTMTVTDASLSQALAYYARHNCALFPIPHGSKSPTGIISSFAHDHSKDPAQWSAWYQQHNCNFGLVAGPSNLIICDIDTKTSREDAWRMWCDLCAEWGIPVLQPQIQSPSGGWHVLVKVPEDVDPMSLRQRDAIKKYINTRTANGYVVAAGSVFEGKPYLLMSDADPYPAPAGLLARVAPAQRSTTTNNVGTRDRDDVAALLTWLTERDAFDSYEDWCSCGMSLKLEFGDAGIDLWSLTHREDVTPDLIATKWESFATEPTADSVTLQSFLKRAKDMGWKGQVRKSTESMFGQVAAMASAAGATLQSMPMLAGQEELTRRGLPIIEDFVSSTRAFPTRPNMVEFPTLPDTLKDHGLFQPLSDAIAKVFALTEQKPWKPKRIIGAMALVELVYPDTLSSIGRKIETLGHLFPWREIKLRAKQISDDVERHFVKQDDWIYDSKGLPEADNSDNVAVLLGVLDLEIRWNAWLERMEIRGGSDQLRWSNWTYVDDAIVAKLRTRANRTKTRFKAGKDFFWESLLSLSHENAVDPALIRLKDLELAWDRTPRLMTWMTRVCGLPCEPYYQAVGRNIIGGMVRRIRHPGCKHDTMVVMYGFQGSGKSTLASMLSIDSDWFSDSVMFGDATKELVLSLAGKTIVEVSEMGARGSANTAHMKAMLSRQVDAGRTAYARSVTERPRRNIFIGTTNEDEPLTDTTGNRRFLPVPIKTEIDLEWLKANKDQLIGEAAALESAGDDFTIPRTLWAAAAEHQEKARTQSDAEVILTEWFGEPQTAPDKTEYITAMDLTFIMEKLGSSRYMSNAQRGRLMRNMGFRQEKPYIGQTRTVIWVRGPISLPPAEIPKVGARYMPHEDGLGRPGVVKRAHGG